MSNKPLQSKPKRIHYTVAGADTPEMRKHFKVMRADNEQRARIAHLDVVVGPIVEPDKESPFPMGYEQGDNNRHHLFGGHANGAPDSK